MATSLFSSPDFEQKYAEYLATWLATGAPDDDYYLESVKVALDSLYEQLGIKHYQYVVCSGPLELTVFPALIEMALKMGQSIASEFKFEKLGPELPGVRTEWLRLWQTAIAQIDWTNVELNHPQLGPLIDSRIEDAVMKPLALRLTAEIDVDLDTEHHQELQKRIRKDLRMMARRFKGAMMFNRQERALLWRSVLNTVPSNLHPLIGQEPGKPIVDERLWLNGRPARVKQPPLHPSKLQGRLVGSFDWTWIASVDFAHTHLKCKLPDSMITQLNSWRHLMAGATGYLFFENCCFVYLRPLEAHFDEEGRLHHDQRAAAEFVDGSSFFFWHGVEVPDYIIQEPEKITVKAIENERNIELRRIMLERYGFENYIRRGMVKKVQEDKFGKLYRKELPNDEPLVIVRVTNSTPEPDGTFKEYYLRVPPDTETAKQGIAWTFGLTEREYFPEKET